MRRVIIMGAGGRDFHDFNVVFRDDPRSEVIAFTTARLHGNTDERYPPALAGPRYPEGIPPAPRPSSRRSWRCTRSTRSPRLLRSLARRGDAQGLARPCDGCGLPAARPEGDDVAEPQAGDRGRGRPHRCGQEPDQPADRADLDRRRYQGRARSASNDVRRPRVDARTALRVARGHRRGASDDRGARGARTPCRARNGHVRRRRLRRDPRPRGAGGAT